MQTITIAHSPDADDIFMAYGLACGAVTIPGVQFEFVMDDIETLNKCALEDRYPMTAISFHAYPYIHKQYRLMTVGASMGEADYGPIVVAKTELDESQLSNATIAIPGRYTSAALILKLAFPKAKTVIMPFNDILPAVIDGRVDAGLLIHESQMQFQDAGCQLILNLPQWWQKKFKLPIPLGTNALSKHLDSTLQEQLVKAQRDSILYAMANRDAALRYTQETRDGNLPISFLDQYIARYVNQRTVAINDEERRAVQALYDAGFECGALTEKITPEWI
ncbi:MAG: ABC transporter substrate-binding protein [Deltaproteobacteria bacterium CG11_big_fil_rev_8_21_14_0_20_47_16]|nr:MAG: ABC transporter substrate-binding protein [Deltaproteobacteria bacterium CG11_big_fil_rev_8_21_14_0_20_47_16]